MTNINKTIYDWLLKSSSSITTTIIIDYILILSINGFYISFESLLKLINIIIEKDRSFYGLNYNQFNILKNNIKTTLNNNNSSSSNEYSTCNNEYNKFNCSIFIINENNKLNINKEIITINNSGNNDNDNDNDKLFFKIWRNVVIRDQILFHIGLNSIHSNKIFDYSINQLSNYKYKNYITHLNIIKESNNNDEIINDLNEIKRILPINLKYLGFKNLTGFTNSKDELEDKIILNNILPKSITSISLNHFNKPLPPPSQVFSNSITSINFGNSFNQVLSGSWLPRNLKSLCFGSKFSQSIKRNVLPKSLTSLILPFNYIGIIEEGSIPKLVTTLDYVTKSKFNIPNSITNLTFHEDFLESIGIGDIPHNVHYLRFNGYCQYDIEPGAIPSSVTSLFINDFSEQIQIDTLPPNLKSLEFNFHFNKILSSNILPTSLTHIKFSDLYNKAISNDLFLNTKLIKSIIFKNKPSPIQLPNTLTHLDIGNFLYDLNELIQILPKSSSLISLILRYKDTPIKTSLNDQEILINLLKNLKQIEFTNTNNTSSADINSFINLLPTTIETIILKNQNIDLLNSFDSNYFHNKIKIKDNYGN